MVEVPVDPEKLATPVTGQYSRKRAIRLAEEIASRRIEPLNLYQPLSHQDEFHRCTATERMLQGGNRAGKSLPAFVEDARAVLGKDPYKKYPARDGVLAVVGYKEWHIGNVVYPYLFKAGAFKIIRDEETDRWRVFRPWVPQDKERVKEAKPVPPLIPPRMIKKVVWKDRGKQVFSNVYLKTGWEIKAFSSAARPDQGYQADLIHFDEDVLDPMWYQEAAGRIIDRSGRIIWSALPHDDNDAIARFAERAEMQLEEEGRNGKKPTTVVFRASMQSNPYLPKEAKEAAIAGWKSLGDDVYRKRALGELVTDSVLMYPMWKQPLLDIRSYFDSSNDATDYVKSGGSIPSSWCRRISIDPGHHTAAALFVATPPSAEFHLVYDELYIHQATANSVAEALRLKTMGRCIQTFIIDAHGGALTSIETGLSPKEAYEEHMQRLGISCVETGHRFVGGCDKISYREEITRGMLVVHEAQHPQILVDFEKCPNLDREMRRFRKKKINDQVIDTGNRRFNTHAAECLEYIATYLHDARNKYIKPKSTQRSSTPGQRRVRAYHERISQRQEAMNPFGITSTIILGPMGDYSA